MIKNIIIALLVGIVIGQNCKADSNDAISKRDLITAAALSGILANPNSNPLGWKPFNEFRNKMRSGDQFVEGANHYADLVINPTYDRERER
jgi:hypothetical protein